MFSASLRMRVSAGSLALPRPLESLSVDAYSYVFLYEKNRQDSGSLMTILMVR
jgi:hypothetical protein